MRRELSRLAIAAISCALMTYSAHPALSQPIRNASGSDSLSVNRSTSNRIPALPAPQTTIKTNQSVPHLSDLMNQQSGNSQDPNLKSDQGNASAPCSSAGCSAHSSNENEDCVASTVDTVNGGCIGANFKYTPLAPFDVICGQTWAQTIAGEGFKTDVDWYLMTGITWGDSITFCITAEFDFDYGFWDWGGCPDLTLRSSGSGSACDTICISMRTENGYQHAITIRPAAANPVTMTCATGPWNYQISLIKLCDFECPPGAVSEGEGCLPDPPVDNFNGGCFSAPPVYSLITPDVTVCGTVSSVDFWRDSDWYRTGFALNSGQLVRFIVTAEFPFGLFIADQRRGCVTREVAGDVGSPCGTREIRWTVDTAGTYAFVIGALQSDHLYPCSEGPWKYSATLKICSFACSPDAAPEGEPCLQDQDDHTNGGCNSSPFVAPTIGAGQRICGETWRSATLRDTDWYRFNAKAGEAVTWTVRADFITQIGVIHLGNNGCQSTFLYPFAIGYTRCEPASVTYMPMIDENVYLFVSSVDDPSQLPTCATGPWEYEALVETTPCVCQCQGDPDGCDGDVDVFDVTKAINVAFRGQVGGLDPNAACPFSPMDVNCDGVVNVFDVTRFVNVAFRGSNPATEFCHNCDSVN